jgi:hypothetical protein
MQERVLSDANWISLARRMEVSPGDLPEWKTARTPVYDFIMEQLSFCQRQSASRILCDIPEIGKTYTARHYVKANKNAIYIDCSQAKTKRKLVRTIARELGVGHSGKYEDVYAELVFYLRSLPSPLIVLDETGDLMYEAFLELKALWNATEHCCGWYMMGADGLKEKMERSILFRKVGYAELFSRYGGRYYKPSPSSESETKEYKYLICARMIEVNASELDREETRRMIVRSDYSPRRIYDEIMKLRVESKGMNPLVKVES